MPQGVVAAVGLDRERFAAKPLTMSSDPSGGIHRQEG